MIGKVNKAVTYDITITQEELSYLKDLLQNYHGNSSDEPEHEMKLRSDLFHGLDSIDERSNIRRSSNTATRNHGKKSSNTATRNHGKKSSGKRNIKTIFGIPEEEYLGSPEERNSRTILGVPID